jgi:hypothetical protein
MFEKSYQYFIGGSSSIIVSVKSGFLAVISYVPGEMPSSEKLWEVAIWMAVVFFGAMLGDIAKRLVGFTIQYHKKRMRLRRIQKARS